jgi:signal transduction histidine kinase
LLSGGGWQTYRSPDGLPSASVNCLLQDKAGTLWAGTDAGLAYGKGAGFASLPHAPPALREPVLGLAQDEHGWLWVSTSNHVLRVNRAAILQDSLNDSSIVEYGLEDGLRGVEGVKRQHSVWADQKGRIWFSLNRGISVVDPSRLRSSSEPGKPQLQSITADGAELGIHGALRVPAGRRRVVFHYAGLSLSVPDRVQFRYKLDDFDRNWSKPVRNRQAEYTNLGPGRYRFRVMASNPDGVWSGTEASVVFSVEPAYWQTWWFRLTIVLLTAAAIGAVYRLRLRRLTAGLSVRFEERLAERTRIAQELHDTLLQGFISASMQLHVAAEKIPAESSVKPAVLKTLDLMKRVTEEGRNAVRGLRAAHSTSLDLEEALSRIKSEVPPDAAATLQVLSQGKPTPLHPVLRDEVYRIGREAILNAFRHAGAQKIEAELDYSTSVFRLTVRDDGCGIEPQTLRAGKDGHWGLPGMRERADRIGARLRLSSNPGSGTEVELIVPSLVADRTRERKNGS